MGPEYFFAALIVLVLLGMAGYYAWRQIRLLGQLRRGDFTLEDRRYYRGQAWRRLVGCALMLVMAALLIASYGLGQEQQAEQVTHAGKAASGAKPALTDENRRFLQQYSQFWILFTLVLLAWVCLAFFDMWAIRRYGKRQFRQIQAEHRAELENQVAQLRSQRNGHT
jgi:NADH:ubiquinone oxidoreductase subunit 3 (subunit A)